MKKNISVIIEEPIGFLCEMSFLHGATQGRNIPELVHINKVLEQLMEKEDE